MTDLQILPKDVIIEHRNGYDKKYGARPLRRMIQSKIEDTLSDEILNGNVTNGDSITISVRNKEVIILKK